MKERVAPQLEPYLKHRLAAVLPESTREALVLEIVARTVELFRRIDGHERTRKRCKSHPRLQVTMDSHDPMWREWNDMDYTLRVALSNVAAQGLLHEYDKNGKRVVRHPGDDPRGRVVGDGATDRHLIGDAFGD